MWEAETGNSPTPPEISKDAVLKNARFSNDGLSLTAEHNGVVYTGIIARSLNLSEDFLIMLRHFLMQHWGDPIEVVENFDLESNGYFRFVR
jgi:hypothetical protein